MSDLVSTEWVVAPSATGGAKIAGESFVDSGDAVTKFLSWGACMWGEKGGDYFLVNETTPLPSSLYADGVALIAATADPGSSDVGLVVRVAGAVSQGDPALIADAWMTKLTNGTIAATLTTVSSKNCLDVNIVGGGGGGSSIVDDAAFVIGTSSVTVAAGVYKATRDSVNDGDAGGLAMTATRALYVSLESPAGDSLVNDTWNSVVTSDAFPTSVTGTITSAAATSSLACSGLGTVSVSLTGDTSGLDFTFQVSNDGGTEWADVYAVRRDTNAFDAGPDGFTLSSATAMWQVDVKGMTHFRLNPTVAASDTSLDFVFQGSAGEFTTVPDGQEANTTQVATADLSNVATSTSSVTLLSANTDRRAATIWNDSATALYVKFGATASATSCTVKIAADGYYELPQPCYTGIIDAILSAGSGSARITELS